MSAAVILNDVLNFAEGYVAAPSAVIFFFFLCWYSRPRLPCPPFLTEWLTFAPFTVGLILLPIGDPANHMQIAGAIASFLTAFILWLFDRHRRRRDRTPKLIGAKSRALIARMVATLRERATPRPVLRPAPSPT